jgi:hypothetical protein
MKTHQNSFVGGEIAPELWGRTDLKKYFDGAAMLRNMVVQRTGGVTKRQGTDLVFDLTSIAGVGTSSYGCRMIPFLFDSSTSFLVVLVNKKAYFFRNGVPVFADGRTTHYSIDTPYEFDSLGSIRFFQSGDTLFLTHPSYRPAKLMRYGDADWRLSLISFDISVSAPSGLVATAYAGTEAIAQDASATSCVYSYCVSAIVDGVESKTSSIVTWRLFSPWPAGQSIQLAWNEVAGAEGYRVYKKSFGSFGYIGYTTVASSTSFTGTVTGSAPATTGLVNNVASNLSDQKVEEIDAATGAHKSYYQVWIDWNAEFGQGRHTVFSFDLGSSRSVSGCRIAWGARTKGTNGVVSGVNGVSSVKGGDWGEVAAFVVEVSSNGSSWSAIATLPCQSDQVGITSGLVSYEWTTVVCRYIRVIAVLNYNAVVITMRELSFFDTSPAVKFTDINISPDTTDGPTDATDPWDADTGFPATMTLFQQRSVWAGTPSAKAQVMMSATGNLYCFNSSLPSKPDDKIDVMLPITRPGEIKHIVAGRSLMFLTESGEWVMSYDEAKGIAYDSIRFNQNSLFGCCDVVPLSIGNSALFVNRPGRVVYEYQYQLASDGFAASDRIILSNHLTVSAKIVGWAYQYQPHSVVWCVLSDGSMIALTYLPEHEIWAWSRHDLDGGRVFDVVSTGAALQGADGDTSTDEVYLVVGRGDGLFLERMRVVSQSATPLCGDAICMDACQRIDIGAYKTSFAIPGTHTVVPDGAYTVVNLETGASQDADVLAGVVTVGSAVRYLMLGKAITSKVETMRPEHPQFSLQSQRQNVKGITLRLYRSGGGTAGALGARTNELALPDSTPTVLLSPEGDPDCTVNLVTTDSRLSMTGMWNRDGQSSITHSSHWPFSILSMAVDLDAEGGR